MNCFQHLPESRGAIAQPSRGGATKKKADSTTPHALSASNTHAHHNQAHCTTALAHLPSLLTERATHAHPLHPAALAFVSYGIVLVRVRVHDTRGAISPTGSPLPEPDPRAHTPCMKILPEIPHQSMPCKKPPRLPPARALSS